MMAKIMKDVLQTSREEWLTSNKPKWGSTYVYWMTQLQVHYYKWDDGGGLEGQKG